MPGRMLLYAQPTAPWVLMGRLSGRDLERLRRAGALIETLDSAGQTIVTWPGTTLRDFMLFDVLMHEVAHHMIQQYTGKYSARVRRTRDHEAFADYVAVQCRRRYERHDTAVPWNRQYVPSLADTVRPPRLPPVATT